MLPAHRMGPFLPHNRPDLEDKALAVLERSAALSGRLHPVTLARVEALLSVINSYYSNRIEGHDTHPVDIERAMRSDLSEDPARRILQIESCVHVEVQSRLSEALAAKPALNPAEVRFLRGIHLEFYARLPEELRHVQDGEGNRLEVNAGELRLRHVQVGRHVPVNPADVPALMDTLEKEYDPSGKHGLQPLLAAAASHHRLMWIHPFLDGNGRVARLFTDTYLRRIGVTGYGLWNVSRGLARRRDDYMRALAIADAPRAGDLDGRAALSMKGLGDFVEFFLDVCLDQADYMCRQLATDTFSERIDGYVKMRHNRLLPGPARETQPLREESSPLLRDLALRGEIERGEVARITGVPERTARRLLNELLAEGLVESDSPRGRLRLGLPAHAASRYFPDLYPER